jgi:long-chain fatty acid transport protein
MTTRKFIRAACLAGSASILAMASTGAFAGAFGVREQSTYFQGMAFAGSAAGGSISSMYWNSAAAATAPGFNTYASATIVAGSSDIAPTGGLFVTGNPPVVPGRGSASADIGTEGFVPSSFATYQLSERLYAGLGLNAPFGFVTKPDNLGYAGGAIGTASKVFSIDINPTLAYKLTPELTVGIGAQIEYFKIRLNKNSFNAGPLAGGLAVSAEREYDAYDWGYGATAGVIWQPTSRTSFGLGYRSAVGVDVSGQYRRGASPLNPFPPAQPAANTNAVGGITLPETVTFSVRQDLTDRLTLLGTVEWTNWSRVGNVKARSSSCPGGVCETLNLNYEDGWFYSLGVEYKWSPNLTLRSGVAFEESPIKDATRSTLLPDSDRVWLSVGASYRYSDRITVDLAYSHLFFDDAPICVASPATGSTNCTANTPPFAKVFLGNADNSVDIFSVGMKYKVSGPVAELEPYK